MGVSVDFELMTRIKNGDTKAKEALFEKYKPLMNKMVKKCFETSRKAHVQVDYDELIQEQYIGFSRAVDNVDLDRIVTAKKANPESWNFYICLWGYLQVTNRDYIHKLINISKYETSSIVEAGEDELDLSDYSTVKNDSYVSAEDEFFLNEESVIFKKTLNKMMKTMNTTERKLWDMKARGLKPKEIRESLNMTQKEYNSTMKRLKNMWNDFSRDASARSHREHIYKL